MSSDGYLCYENCSKKYVEFRLLCQHTKMEIFSIISIVNETNEGGKTMSRPYVKGDRWYIKLDSGYEIEFNSYEEAWDYYDEHLE